MAKLDILTYPDPRLHKVAKPVEVVDDRIRQLVKDMAETMYEAPGIGLAATQVDVHERVIVIDISESRDELMVFINPEVTWASENRKVWEEGCLSVPEVYDRVERPDRVKVRALDEKGETFELDADDLLAVCTARDRSPRWQGIRGIPVATQAPTHQEQAPEARALAHVRM
jgi:peptide deformylase